MLDRSKLMKEFGLISDQLFVDFSSERNVARAIWDQISNDPTFSYKIRAVDSPLPLPTWQGILGRSIPIKKKINNYSVISVDGSQIYPDKHQGTSVFLINIGTVELHYGTHQQKISNNVYLNTQPHIFTPQQDEKLFETSAMDLVNCRRQEFELREGLVRSEILSQKIIDQPMVFLIDGSLIFWHLDSKAPEIKHTFLSCYLALMHQLYEIKMPFAGYISLPKSKELVNLVRVALTELNYANENETCQAVDHIIDTTIAHFYLQPNHRSIVFQNHATISDQYPNHLRPHFFYVHVGTEIGRVEIPAWIAQDEKLVDQTAQIILDQSIKGRGYPVAIAESHEQAVVKGPDREFFYQLILKASYEQKRHLVMSAKSVKKRGIGI